MLNPVRLLLACLFSLAIWQQAAGQAVNSCSYQPPREGENWCFYSNCRLQFSGGSVSFSALSNTLQFGKGCASISDANGNLLMFTDGMKLWDKSSYLLSETLDGDLGATQSSLIVPNPSGNGTYYIFTIDLLLPPPMVIKGLNYSTIDLATATGNDTLPVKRLLDQTPEKITGVRHANGVDYWVVAHGWGDNAFYAYRVTAKGVDSIPVVSHAGMIQSGTMGQKNMIGAMKLSPDGTRLAQAIMGANLIEWFDFNTGTGVVSNLRQIPSPDMNGPYGLEFSPDAQYLYFTTINPSTNTSNNLYQADLVNGGAPVLLNNLAHNMTALQLAVDGKIYVARLGYGFLGVIENPNRPDTACNFKEDGQSLNGNKSLLGLPNFIQSYFDIPSITYDTKCEGDETFFYLNNTANIDSMDWFFGDPASGSANTDNRIQASHFYTAAGDYKVQAVEWFNNLSYSSTFQVKINPLPPKCFADDSIYILPGSAIQLDAGAYMQSYLWQDGSTLQTLEVSQPGYYHVTYVDTNCCQQSDTIKVLLLDLVVPNAFSPNYDGLNDRFRVKGPTQGVDNFEMYIYNRWGQLLWESHDFNDNWDGTYKGKDCPLGSYVWVMKFGVTGNLISKDKVVKRGMVTIVR